MADALIQRKKSEGDQEIVLRLLEHVETGDAVSQDRFAKRLGIAKGLANAYFNRCLQKGWIKLSQVPKQRFLYYLTPRGLAEKARLSAQFLTHSYQFYREARSDMAHLFSELADEGHRRVGVLGAGELAEIAAIVSEDARVSVVGFLDPVVTRKTLVGRPVVSNWDHLGEGMDCAVLATIEDARDVLSSFLSERPDVPVFIPSQLRSLLWGKTT